RPPAAAGAAVDALPEPGRRGGRGSVTLGRRERPPLLRPPGAPALGLAARARNPRSPRTPPRPAPHPARSPPPTRASRRRPRPRPGGAPPSPPRRAPAAAAAPPPAAPPPAAGGPRRAGPAPAADASAHRLQVPRQIRPPGGPHRRDRDGERHLQ